MSDTEKMIDEHRRMVVLTGNLSDFQIKNLNMWPLVVFEKDSINEITLDYDFTEKVGDEEKLSAGTVQYNIDFNNNIFLTEDEISKRLSEMKRWTKHLFWEDTQVDFNILKNGEKWEI